MVLRNNSSWRLRLPMKAPRGQRSTSLQGVRPDEQATILSSPTIFPKGCTDPSQSDRELAVFEGRLSRSITVSPHGGIEALRRCLSSLGQAFSRFRSAHAHEAERFELVVFTDPHRELVDECRSVNFVRTRLFVNGDHLGNGLNTVQSLAYVFGRGTEFNVHLRGDALLTPDAFDCALYYLQEFATSPLSHLFYSLVATPAAPFDERAFCLFYANWFQYLGPNLFLSEDGRHGWRLATYGKQGIGPLAPATSVATFSTRGLAW